MLFRSAAPARAAQRRADPAKDRPRRKAKKSARPKAACAPVVSVAQKEALRLQVAETIAGVLGSTVGEDEPLMDAGLDSLGAVELRNGLSGTVGVELPSTLVFDYPSVGALAGFLETQVAPTTTGAEEAYDSEEEVCVRPRRAKLSKKSSRHPITAGLSSDQQEALRVQVGETVAGVVGAAVDDETPLMDAGLDSLGAVELRNADRKSVV